VASFRIAPVRYNARAGREARAPVSCTAVSRRLRSADLQLEGKKMKETVKVTLDEYERQIVIKYKCAYGVEEMLKSAPPGECTLEVDPIHLQWMAQDLCHANVRGKVPDHLLDEVDALCTRLERLSGV
jgi:hypothetical protein